MNGPAFQWNRNIFAICSPSWLGVSRSRMRKTRTSLRCRTTAHDLFNTTSQTFSSETLHTSGALPASESPTINCFGEKLREEQSVNLLTTSLRKGWDHELANANHLRSTVSTIILRILHQTAVPILVLGPINCERRMMDTACYTELVPSSLRRQIM